MRLKILASLTESNDCEVIGLGSGQLRVRHYAHFSSSSSSSLVSRISAVIIESGNCWLAYALDQITSRQMLFRADRQMQTIPHLKKSRKIQPRVWESHFSIYSIDIDSGVEDP